MKKVIVKTQSKNYPVYIGSNIIQDLPELIRNSNLPERIFIIIDKKVDKIYGTTIRKILGRRFTKISYLVLPADERIKSLKSLAHIYGALINENFGKDSLLISIGGGTIGDVSGFAASTFMRGIPVIHVPTTLLSAVDSSVGGKTGINFYNAKNLVGTFYQPSFVLTDCDLLNYLPSNELISGFGEVMKYSYLTDEKFYSQLLSEYSLLLQKDKAFFERIVYESIKIKSSVVSADEKESTGLRKILNFGHTFAHSLETVSGYKLPHGKAVIAGIICAIYLSAELGLLTSSQVNYMLELPDHFSSFIETDRMNEKEILRMMTYDKKNIAGNNRFVLIRNFGEILVDVLPEQKLVYNSLRKARKILV